MDLVIVAAWLILLITLVSAVDLFFGMRSMRRLSDVPPLKNGSLPKVSLIVPACNEAENIEQALCSQLGQEYENFEIIAINDRSTDGTGIVLEKMAKKHPRLKVIHVETLPDGWMGKANALQSGALEARGKYLLFTDGDIHMEKTAIARAVHHSEAEQLDHLTLLFRNTAPGWLLNSLILDSGAGLIQALRPWLARRKSRYFVGVGAFNLVKKSVYQAVGRHSEIKMHPIDDIMLGKLIKRKGYSQECLLATDLISVSWYAGVADMANGLMKNILAIINYRFILLPLLLMVIAMFSIVPLWGLILLRGPEQLVFTAVVAVRLLAFFTGTKLLRLSPWCTFGTLLTPYLTIFIILRAAWFNQRDDGIVWRGTHYSLAELKKNESIFP